MRSMPRCRRRGIPLRAALRASRVPLDRAVAAALAAREHAPPALRFGLAWLLPDEPRLFTADDEAYGLTCEGDPGPTYDLA